MSRKATQKQHAFALAYLETGKPSESYRDAGYKCDRMTNNAIAVQANRLLKNPNVDLIIEKGRAEARERCQVTIESLIDELEENRQCALTAVPRQATAAVAATMAKAKLHGLADGQRPQPEDGAGPQRDVPSQWAEVRARLAAVLKEAEDERSEAGNGADGNGAAPTDTGH